MAMIWMSIGVMLIMGRFTMYMIRGPVGDMMHMTRVAVVETQIFSASQVVMMSAVGQEDNGDCDSDEFVEPTPYRQPGKESSPRPEGGGYIPLTVGAAKTDPWGTEYGYCAWNHGGKRSENGCEDEGRLYGTDSRDQPVVAVISAGRDRTFQTTCREWDDYWEDTHDPELEPQKLIEKASGSDDIILSWTYTEATGATGGLWRLKDDDPGTAEIKKDLEVEGALRLTNGPVFLLGGGLQLSDQNIVGACGVSTANQLRLNTEDSPPTIEICDRYGTGEWEKMTGGGGPLPDETELATCDADSEGTLRRNTTETPSLIEVCDFSKSGNWEPVGAGGIETDSMAACDAGKKGSLRWKDSKACMEVCDGISWACLLHVQCPTSGLSGYWNFDESSGTSLADSSGNGNTGTLINGPVWNPTGGKRNGALQFDGIDDYVSVPSSADLDSGRTWMFFFKTNGVWGTDGLSISDSALLISRHDGVSSTNGITITLHISGVYAVIKNNAGDVCNAAYNSNDLINNDWHHIALVFSREKGYLNQLYVDGVLRGSCANIESWDFNNQSLHLGDSSDIWWEEYQGLIDDFRIYNSQLSSQEILAIYNSDDQCE